ncbi:MAG: dTDP-4-keto-6-deoxy-D-glucose epimerase [Actinobacteria bacterium]|nr:dTDP-4-keto-6-deoxy-D-glucose epimerase [Actinomycetota bacterium]
MATLTPAPEIAGVVIVEPTIWADARGMFAETFRQEWLPEGSPTMVQGNRADRQADTLVGLHYHRFQADYWYVPFGRVLAALHDLRKSSPTRGASLTVELNGEQHRGLYIPRGVAHGFYAITDATITYLVDNYYNPDDELGVAWDDPAMGIDWPGRDPILSDRDRANPLIADIPPELAPE